jgi:hypothetical protein
MSVSIFGPKFWRAVRAKQKSGQREGQAVFSTASELFPRAARLLTGTLLDPFYRDDRVGEFLTAVAQYETDNNPRK